MAGSSILTSIKKILGVAEDYTAFDPDIVMYINSALSTLNQLGLGPVDGLEIEDKTTTWDAFYTDPKLNGIKTYVGLSARLLFDPPQTSYLITALNDQVEQLVWRLNTIREGASWTDPNPAPTP